MSFTPTVDDTDRYETIDITAERFTYPVSTATLAGVAAPIKGNNLLEASNNISDSSWTKTRASPGATVDVTLDSGEVVTLTKLVEDGTAANSHQLEQTAIGGNPINPHVLTFLVMTAGESRRIVPSLWADSASNSVFAVINPDLGTVVSTGITGTSVLGEATITVVGTHSGSTIYRVKLSGNGIVAATTLNRARFGLDNGTTTSYNGDSTSGVYIGQMQITEGTEATTYSATTTERISGDGQRLTHSGDLSNAAHTKTRTTVSGTTHNATLDTGEVLVMQKLVEDGTAGATHVLFSSSDISAAGIASIMTVRLKLADAGRPYVRVSVQEAGTATSIIYGRINLSTGAVDSVTNSGTASGAAMSSSDAGDGVWDVVISGTPSTSGTVLRIAIYIMAGDGSSISYNGDAASGIYIAEPILVAGSTAPSYTRSYADRLASGGSTRDRASVLLPHIREFDASGTHVGTLWDIDKPLVLTDGTDTDTRQIQFTAPVPANYAAVAAPAPYQWAPDGAGPTDNAYLHEIEAGNARKNPKRWEYDLATGQAEIWAMAANTVTGQWRARRVVRDFVRKMTNGAGTYEYARARQEEDELIQIMAAFLSTR